MRAIIAALIALAACGAPARARPATSSRVSVSGLVLASSNGIGALLRGPEIRPGTLIVVEPDGRMRTLELDELAPLRLRLSIPF